LVQDQKVVNLITIAEQYAESQVDWKSVITAADGSDDAMQPPRSRKTRRTILNLANEDAWQAAIGVVQGIEDLLGKAPCDLMRDIFGNPFQPITLDPSWLTSTVISLAQQIDVQHPQLLRDADPGRCVNGCRLLERNDP
jgi:hypothetical protein